MLIQKEPETNEEVIKAGYEGITLVMDYLEDIVIKMINAGTDCPRLIEELAKDFCKIRKKILEKSDEEGQDVFPAEPEDQIPGQTEITLEANGTYSFKTNESEEGGQHE